MQRRFANQQGVREADFLTVVAWRQTAEYVNKYLHKGDKIGVEGSIQVRQYDAQDGSKRTVTEIIADHIEGLSRRADSGEEAPKEPAAPEDFKEVQDDELPF